MLLFNSHNFTAWFYQFHLEKGHFCFSYLFNIIITTRRLVYHYEALFIIQPICTPQLVSFREGICLFSFSLDKTPSSGFPLSQQLKAVNHSIMTEVKSLPLSSRKFSPWYPEILSVPRALFTNLSWSSLLYCIRLLLTDIETRRQPRGHPFFRFSFL